LNSRGLLSDGNSFNIRATNSNQATFEQGLIMRVWYCVVLLAAVATLGTRSYQRAAGQSQTLLPERAAAVDEGVRVFMRAVAHDVTQDGPSAWRKHFADDPAFFMAAEGVLVLPNSAAATATIQELTRSIKHIELQWGEDLRVDPLTADFAVVGCTYHELRVDTNGQRIDERGYFTGTAELRDGRWQFRNAHWSVIVPPSPVP
jgi:hypothetical protein